MLTSKVDESEMPVEEAGLNFDAKIEEIGDAHVLGALSLQLEAPRTRVIPEWEKKIIDVIMSSTPLLIEY